MPRAVLSSNSRLHEEFLMSFNGERLQMLTSICIFFFLVVLAFSAAHEIIRCFGSTLLRVTEMTFLLGLIRWHVATRTW